MRKTLLYILLPFNFVIAFSQETDTTVVYEYDTVYLPTDTIEQKIVSAPPSSVPVQSNSFSLLAFFTGFNLTGDDQNSQFATSTAYYKSFSCDASVGFRWVLSSVLLQTGLGIGMYSEKLRSTEYSHSDTSVLTDEPDARNSLQVYYTSEYRNSWTCLNVPLALGYSDQWKKLEYHLSAGIALGYTLQANIYHIDQASESLIKANPSEYRKLFASFSGSAGAGYEMLPGLFIEAEAGYRKLLSDGNALPDRLKAGFPVFTLGIRKQFYIKEAHESR